MTAMKKTNVLQFPFLYVVQPCRAELPRGDQDKLHGGRRSCNAVIIRSFKLTFQVSSEGDTGFDYIDEP